MFVDVADLDDLSQISGLYEVLETAFAESGIDFHACDVEDRGDGALILVPPDVSKNSLIDRLPDRLVAVLRRYNATRSPAAQFKLRVAVHAGDIQQRGDIWGGSAVNLAAEILDTPELKSALARSSRSIALAVSDYFHSVVVEPDPGVFPEEYRRIQVPTKTSRDVAWLRLLGDRPADVETSDSPGGAVLGVVPPHEIDVLRGLLAGRDVPHLSTLVARAVGPAIPPTHHDASAWEVFSYLADFNAGPDGVPPALAFLRLLAWEIGGAFEAAMLAWVDQQTRRLRLSVVLAERQAHWSAIPDRVYLHVMIMIEPDAIDPRRCLLSFWRQDDPLVWPPTRGDVRETTVDQLEHQVDELVLEAEQVWADQAVSVVIEFVLARSMLTLPVFRWRKEVRSGDPLPLAVDYQLRLRSLERMRSTYWRRPWRMRWQSMTERMSLDRIHPFGPGAAAPIDLALNDPRWVGLVLEEPPSPVPHSGPDPFTAALRAGLPLICWHPTARPQEVREQVDWLLDGERGVVDLPERHRTALLSPPSGRNDNPIRDLAVMWDDPNRVIDLDLTSSSSVSFQDVDFDLPRVPERMPGFDRPAIPSRPPEPAPPPVPIARISCPATNRVRIGEPTSVDFALTGAGATVPPLPRPVRLRVLLDAGGCVARPVTRLTWLGTDRTTRAVTFTVTPDVTPVVPLTFRVYRDSDSQLLMEITTRLPVTEPVGEAIG